MTPAMRRFDAKYLPLANAISRLDIPQTIREEVAAAVAEALRGDARNHPDFDARLFKHLASDPMSACPGHGDTPCPHGREIRTPMHLSTAPDGRSAMWRETKPAVLCAECGFAAHLAKAAS
jgi:hypothetical protein